jgi:hypothetical protein
MTAERVSVPAMNDYWTDDRAPVEWTTDRMIIVYGVSGKDRGEQMRPTHPSGG